ncbi:hypothetical protein ACFW04_008592 [Cataglyphis niger]
MFGNTVQAKLVSMVLIGAGSFFIGITPACFISSAQRLQRKLLLSCALCFGAGVLLATSMLHVLPEVRKDLPDYAELVFSCGFLVLYLVEECVHYFCRSGDHVVEMDDSRHRNTNKRGGYGATRCHAHDGPSSSEETTFLCHGNHGEQCTDANTGLAGLALALTVHAVLEGLAIGLQTQIAEVLLLTGAVASHKYVVSFCLGLELVGVSKSVPKLIFAIFVFAVGSVIGIGIGMLTFQADTDWSKVVLPILQGLAGGTLLYVTVSEVLPRERAKWHKSSRRFAGILQFFSVFVGFVVIFLLNNYVGE